MSCKSEKKIVLQAGSKFLTLNFKTMKKFAVILLILMISSFASEASTKTSFKKALGKRKVVGSYTTYPITRGRIQIGDEMVCTDNAGRVTRYRTIW